MGHPGALVSSSLDTGQNDEASENTLYADADRELKAVAALPFIGVEKDLCRAHVSMH